MRIDHISGVPLYVKTREKLRAELASMKAGALIPSETVLEKKFGVSRITLRRAIEQLVNEGLLLRQQGRGTFVQRPKLTHELKLVSSWTDQLTCHGFSPRTVKRTITREMPSQEVLEALHLSPGEEVVRVQRVRLASREPISYMTNYFPASLVPKLSARHSLGESLYLFLEREYNLVPAHAVDIVGTRLPTPEEMKALKIDRQSPVLSVRRVSYLENGAPLELSLVASRGDRYQYEITVHGRPSKQPRA